ncbi:MAG: N-acetylmuramoyl-L-alanine amidase [Chlorobiaceae bacterium]|nr:N-acetylmuramoyl-L-alanine amidase [Chlorobiaceae bacterium]
MQVSNGPAQSYTIKVLGYRTGGDFYADIGAFARALRLGSVFDGSKMQIDEAYGALVTSCIIREGSEFVVIDSVAGDTGKRIIQLASAPSIKQERMFLPLSQACRMFSLWLGREVQFDSSANRIGAELGDQGQDASLRSIGLLGNETTPAAEGADSGKNRGTRVFTGKTVIDDIRVETMANGIILRFSASGLKTETSFLRPDANGVAYLTFENTGGTLSRLSRSYSQGPLRSITPLPLDGGSMQFSIVLDPKAMVIRSSSFRYDPATNDYVVSFLSDVDVEAIHRTEKERLIQTRLSQDADKWKLDALVIDAGHGGKDSGAVGTRGTKEKDVVLNIAHDLGMFIKQKWPEIKVIYTRKDDHFIPLNDRGKIANRYGGKLFISVHCNAAAANSKVRGPEVYILGPHKTQSSLQVAMLENSVITGEENYSESYKGFSDEYLIMSSMAQSAFAMQSTELAQDVLRRLGREGSNNGLGVRQAGFMVLWTPSMPSVLVETGYLSNPQEEALLRNRQEQTRIAYAIFQGLQQYRTGYESRTMAAGYNR